SDTRAPRQRFGVDLAGRGQCATRRREEILPGQQPQGIDRLAQGQSRQGLARHRRSRQRIACQRRLLPEGNRHAFPVRALSRHRPGDAGPWRPTQRATGPAMQDLVAGQIDLMFDQAANSLPQVRNGNVKAFAVTAKSRLPSAPDIPTMDEAGMPGFYISVWHGLWVPKGTPKDITARLTGAVVEALGDPAVRRRLDDLGQEIPPRDQQTPEALFAHHKAEIEKWWPIIKAANVKGDETPP